MLPWIERSYVTSLVAPGARSRTTARALLEASGGRRGGVPEAVAQTILGKAEGNPFFIEELARAVTEQGEVRAVQVPDTIQEVLLARMARLSGSAPEPAADGRRPRP